MHVSRMAPRKSLLPLFFPLLPFFSSILDSSKNNFSPFVYVVSTFRAGIICFIQRPMKSFEVIPRQLME